MKRLKIVICISVLAFVISACGGAGVSQEKYDAVVAERDELLERVTALESQLLNKTDNPNVEKEEILENNELKVEVLAEYTYSDGIGWYTYHFMIVKNISNTTVDISTSSLAYSADKTMLSADDASFNALGAGCTSAIYEAFETDKKIHHYETQINVSESKYYESVIQDLTYVQHDIEDGAVFQVTNNGSESAEFVEGYALFFKKGELIGFDSVYFTDDDSEIKPGATISKQLNEYEDFDTIEFYLTGRR